MKQMEGLCLHPCWPQTEYTNHGERRCLHISIPLEVTTSFAPCFAIYCLCDLNNVLTPLFSYLYLTASSVRYKDSLCHVTEEVTVSEDSNISLALFSFTVI